MEKRVVLAIAISLALFLAYAQWFGPKPVPHRASVAQGTVPSAGMAKPAGGSDGAALRKPASQYAEGADERIGNDHLELTVAAKGAGLKAAEAWACVYHDRGDTSVPGDPGLATAWPEGMPGALCLDLLGADVPDLPASPWKLTRTVDSVAAEFEVDGISLTRTITPSHDPGNPFHADVVYAIRNVSAEPGRTRTLEIIGPVMPAPNPAYGDDGVLVAKGGENPEVEFHTALELRTLVGENPRLERKAAVGDRWEWIGVRADFYLGALAPKGNLPPDTTVGFRTGLRTDAHGKPQPTAAPTYRIPFTVPAKGAESRFEFMFYAGPNQRSLLQDDASPYHVFHAATVQRKFLVSLGPIQQFMAWLLKELAATGMGYGLAVLSLTILVRGALFPLSRKSQISMRTHAQKMQRLKPKMDAIKEKHKDPKKQQEATMKLMREEKVSILPGGCLLAFLQMPVWIALYNVLQTTFEMRHARFLWVKDLTAPDHLVHLPFAEGWFVLNGWLNFLPILMMIVWYVSAAMQPLPADPQQAQQAKMMRWMPVAFGFFLYGTAAGLTLYMTMSALWSIGETWLIRKMWLSHLEPAKQV